jgi:hypothetical protein
VNTFRLDSAASGLWSWLTFIVSVPARVAQYQTQKERELVEKEESGKLAPGRFFEERRESDKLLLMNVAWTGSEILSSLPKTEHCLGGF